MNCATAIKLTLVSFLMSLLLLLMPDLSFLELNKEDWPVIATVTRPHFDLKNPSDFACIIRGHRDRRLLVRDLFSSRNDGQVKGVFLLSQYMDVSAYLADRGFSNSSIDECLKELRAALE
jgi:hypothetical protein